MCRLEPQVPNDTRAFAMSPPIQKLMRTASLILLCLPFMMQVHSADATKTSEWVVTWAAAPAPTGQPETFVNQTIRNVAYVSVGGSRVRVRLSNLYGKAPLEIAAAHVAQVDVPPKTIPGSDRTLTVAGAGRFTIPIGAEIYTDPVELSVAPLSALAISIYVPDTFKAHTEHGLGRDTYISAAGDYATAVEFIAAKKIRKFFIVTAVDVSPRSPGGAIIALGDSITDLTCYADNNRWSDYLARRLQALHVAGRIPAIAVANAGISGNQLLGDLAGDSAVKRFDRDVLSHSGARFVILLVGINDIGFSRGDVRAEAMIAGYEAIIAHAHENGLKIFGGTITPFGGSNNSVSTLVDYWSESGEQIRKAVNQWIRTSGRFDGIIDFDAALRDPKDPSRLSSLYDSGDRLHPCDAGFEKMAKVINLSWFK